MFLLTISLIVGFVLSLSLRSIQKHQKLIYVSVIKIFVRARLANEVFDDSLLNFKWTVLLFLPHA